MSDNKSKTLIDVRDEIAYLLHGLDYFSEASFCLLAHGRCEQRFADGYAVVSSDLINRGRSILVAIDRLREA